MNNRYRTIDFFRGFVILNMLFYHIIWDMVYLFNFNLPWFSSRGAYFWERFICFGFIIISGFCFSFGRHRLKRAALVFGLGALITLVTIIFVPEEKIVFGILTFLGFCMAAFIPADRVLKRVNPILGLLACIVLYAFFNHIDFKNIFDGNIFTAFFGIVYEGFYSSDYFPVIPWIFVYGFGYFLNLLFAVNNGFKYLSLIIFKPLELLGKHSLIIYMLHQPVIYLGLYVYTKFFIK